MSCRSGFVHPLPRAEELEGIYTDPQYHTGGLCGFGYEGGPVDNLGELELAVMRSPGRGALLDVGAGRGVASAAAAGLGYAVTATDYEAPPTPMPGVDWIAGDVMGVLAALPPETFDLVVMLQVIEHPLDPQALLDAVARVLKPRGRVLITTPNGTSLGHRGFGGRRAFKISREHLHYFSERGLTLLAQRAGLTVADVQRRGGLGLGLGLGPAASPVPAPSVSLPGVNESRRRTNTLVSAVARRSMPRSLQAELVMTLQRPSG